MVPGDGVMKLRDGGVDAQWTVMLFVSYVNEGKVVIAIR